MSAASQYQIALAAVQATTPTPWTGPGGLMTASVDQNGNMQLLAQGQMYTVPPVVALAFAGWITATFT
jgi:hypothetical protein